MKPMNLLLPLLLSGIVLGGCQQDQAAPAQKTENKAEQKIENQSPAQTQEDNTGDQKQASTDFNADDKVVTIDGKVLTYEDLQFYELMNKVDIELNRQQDEQRLAGQELADKLAYWDEQLDYHGNFNVTLSKMIEQYSMYLLAREKGLKTDEAEVNKALAEFEGKVAQNEPAAKLVSAFPEDAYENRLARYFEEKLLTSQIYETLKTDVLKEKPKATEKEIAYDTTKKYEELYQSQIGSLDLKINAAE